MNSITLLPEDEKITHLYKYRENSAHTFENLTIGQLKFSYPNELNDPFDCKRNVVYEGTEQDWIDWKNKEDSSLEKEKKQRIYDNLKSNGLDGKKISFTQEQEKIKGILVLSLSEINDNLLMWSHYSKSHKGLCLGFKTEVNGNYLRLAFDKSDVNFHSGFLPVQKVKYNIDMPPSCNGLKVDIEKVIAFALTKHPDWKYERERRIIIPITIVGQQMIKYEKNILNEVIFGYKTSEEDIKRTIHILESKYPNSGKDIQLKKATPVDGKYSLNIINL